MTTTPSDPLPSDPVPSDPVPSDPVPSDPARAPVLTPTAPDGPRFARAERVFHWMNASLFAIVMGTGAILYVGELSALVGRRELVRFLHVYGGIALAISFLVAVLPRWGRPLRADMRRLMGGDTKFNRGQQVNASFLMAAVVVMLGTGIVMRWYEPFSLDWRTGATFVHDWFAFGVWVLVAGHVLFALQDPDAMRAMTGRTRISALTAPPDRVQRAENGGGRPGGAA